MEIGKDLTAATATPLILAILSEGESYGYAIIREVEKMSGGHIQWTDGMLYPVLHRLERHGWVEARWGHSETGRRRRYYSLRAEGQAELARQKAQWDAVTRTLGASPFGSLITEAVTI